MDKSYAVIVARIVALLSVCLLAVYTIRWSSRPTHGFAMYYTYSSLVLHGEDFSKAFDFKFFNGKIDQYGMRGVIDMSNNPPTASLTMLPLAVFQPTTAKALWSAISFILLAVSTSILIVVNSIRWRSISFAIVIAGCFLWHPVYENIALGQIYILLLFLFSLGLYGIKRGSPALTSLTVSLALLLKGYGLLVLLWLGINRMKKTLLLVGIFLGLVFLLTLPIFPVQVWINFWQKGFTNLITSPSNAHVSYQTITGFVSHMLHYDPQWSPHPLVSLRRVVAWLFSIVLSLAMIIGVFYAGSKDLSMKEMLLAFCASLAVGVVASPVAEEYHYILFLPLVVGLSSALLTEIKQSEQLDIHGVVFVASVVMLAAPLHFKDLQTASFPLVLLAYPKLFAGSGILWCYARLMDSGRAFKKEIA